MIIAVKEKTGRSFRIVVPTGLLLNRLTAHFMPNALRQQGITLTRSQWIEVIRVLRACRQRHRGWKLLEAKSADGAHVEISL